MWQSGHWYLVSQRPPCSWSCLNGILLDEANLSSVTLFSTPSTWVTGLLAVQLSATLNCATNPLFATFCCCLLKLFSCLTKFFCRDLVYECVYVFCMCRRNYSLPVNLISDRPTVLVSQFDKYAIRMRNWIRNLVARWKLIREIEKEKEVEGVHRKFVKKWFE